LTLCQLPFRVAFVRFVKGRRSIQTN